MKDAGPSETVGAAPLPFQGSPTRSLNERRILAMINANGELPSAELARLAGLSAQTASVITRALEADGLIQKGAPTRGKVGKPITPFRLNPDGAFSVGLRIGRRSAEMVLMDFTGTLRGDKRTTYPYPTPEVILSFAQTALDRLLGKLDPALRSRVIGLGIGTPFEIWNWLELGSTPEHEMLAWKGLNLAHAFADITDLPVAVFNDSSMACSGEHAFGGGAGQSDFVYFYVGALVGGGVVLGNQVYLGPQGNAAAFGSLPMIDREGRWGQLNTQASLVQLEEALNRRFPGQGGAYLRAERWQGFDDLLADWIDRTAQSLAYAALAAVVAYDVPKVVIDCSTPPDVRRALVRRVQAKIAEADTRGILVPNVGEGKFGPFAGALGAGYQPIAMRLLLP